ncbi:MAG: hemolysin family protein [Candidatus Saganbacteria bacterium]|nr:hemolysin family protein [Candidatus Saganbacteria bacterium]
MSDFVLLAVFIALSAFFSLSETAITSVGRIKVKKFLSQNLYGSKALYELREHPNKMLSTILLGNSLVTVAAASVATTMSIKIFSDYGVKSESIAVSVATFIMTALLLIFGEISPKTIAIKFADRISLVVAPMITVISILFKPFNLFFNALCKPIIKFFGADTNISVPFVTEEELKMLLSVSEEEGVLEQEEKEMIHSIFEFSDSIAKQVMVPRPDMFCLDVNTPLSEALVKISEEGHSRIPVYEGTVDNIIGLAFAKDLLRLCVENRNSNLRDIIRPPLFVPETKKLDEIMRQMQSIRTHIAIVVDEYGGVSGLVALEDLLEEIVGEIKDEFDTEEKNIEVFPDGAVLVDARMTVSEVNDKLATSVPEGDYDTIGGFVLSLIGKIPVIGDTARFEDLRITVEKVFKRRITRIKILRIKGAEAEGSSIVGG